ncbi:MAG: hypothetical protein ABL888_22495, partial [Pirellulaceae bacterium]
MNQVSKQLHSRIAFFALAGLYFLCGCQPAEKIETVTVPLSRSGLPIKTPTEDRMVVAVAVRPDATWFFKINGTARGVGQTEASWIGFLKQIQFGSDGQPTWELPDGWRSVPSTNNSPLAARFATLQIPNPDREKVELVVSKLGPEFDRLSNFNRWRGQLGLPPIGEEGLKDEVGELEFNGGKFLMFDRTGTSTGGMTPPMAGGPAAQPPVAPPTSPTPEVAHETPNGWTVNPNASVVAVRMEKKVDDMQFVISVTPLPPKLISWSESVGNWVAETVSTANPTGIESEKTRAIEVAGVSGKRIDLV